MFDCIDSNNINVDFTNNHLNELLLSCTFSFRFSFINEIYKQRDGILIESA